MAVNMTLESAFIAWLAAPVPRPPQPISPTLIVSSLAANVFCGIEKLGNATPAATTAEEDLMNCLRVELVSSLFWIESELDPCAGIC